MPDHAKRVEAIRTLMRAERVDAWIVNGSDPHASEYVAPRWRTRAWISGFTGSAGTVVITADRALLWVDSRYYIQGAQQIEGTGFELMRLDAPNVPDHVQWLSKNLRPNARVGIDGMCMTVTSLRALQSALSMKGLTVVDTPDWFDAVWEDRPPAPESRVSALPEEVAGATADQKLEQIRKQLGVLGCTHTVISSLDDIAWILNLRGSDVEFNPVFLSYLVIGPGDVTLFTEPRRFDEQLLSSMESLVKIKPYGAFHETLGQQFSPSDVIYYAPERTAVRTRSAMPSNVAVVEGRDISTDLKARKNPVEIDGMRRAHLLDGVAMVRLLAFLSRDSEELTELSLAGKLEEFRKASAEYLGSSFSPIAGFGEHGALAHYSATQESSVALQGNNLLVLDTSGQYRTGTTDITRTLLFGKPSAQMRTDYTLVLKGNLALASQRFPEGTCGYQLDTLARRYLWQAGYNYGHGTGHGVGFCLNVHEGPQNISPKLIAVPIEEGMILSDEPGLYREGAYGIRIENLVVARRDGQSDFGNFLAFDVLTLCPFERRLIDPDLLDASERRMVDSYHAWVYSELTDLLPSEDADWLQKATAPL